MQVRHEKSRRGEEFSVAGFAERERVEKPSLNGAGQAPFGRPGMRRRVTGTDGLPPTVGTSPTSPVPSTNSSTAEQPQTRERSRTGGILSPLNPRRVAAAPSALLSFAGGATTRPKSPSLQAAAQSKHRRVPGLGK